MSSLRMTAPPACAALPVVPARPVRDQVGMADALSATRLLVLGLVGMYAIACLAWGVRSFRRQVV